MMLPDYLADWRNDEPEWEQAKKKKKKQNLLFNSYSRQRLQAAGTEAVDTEPGDDNDAMLH